MHPDTDELFLVANGKRRMQILYCKQTENIRVDAGSILVVAANCVDRLNSQHVKAICTKQRLIQGHSLYITL